MKVKEERGEEERRTRKKKHRRKKKSRKKTFCVRRSSDAFHKIYETSMIK